MAKTKKSSLTPELRARFAETMRILEDRMAFHERKTEARRSGGSSAQS
jgi:hypothetical protein